MMKRSLLGNLLLCIWLLATSVILAAGATQKKKNDLLCVDDSSSETCTPMDVPPMIDGGAMMPTPQQESNDVWGCCRAVSNDNKNNNDNKQLEPAKIGSMPQFTTEDTLRVLEQAKQAWNHGNGVWPQLSLGERILKVEQFLDKLQTSRGAIIHILMWEIGKNYPDAAAEFDRTMQFARQVIEVLRTDPEYSATWQTIGSTTALIRRAAIGIILALGPYNYPLNETYAALIPALLLGNVVILKIPTVGGLVHFLTLEAFKVLPKGTIHFVSGSGRATMPPIMASGDVDGLAFIGGSDAADKLILQHPHPHRLKVFLQLEAKNMGIFLPDLFTAKKGAGLENALNQAITGSLSYNGQRCTALKILFVPAKHADAFTKAFVQKVESQSVGLPWQTSGDSYSKLTPLPNQKRVKYMNQLIDDAVQKGAKVMNKNGGTIVGGANSTLFVPAVLYPVTPHMMVYREEQFGPVIPIFPYDELETVLHYGQTSPYAQQISIFTIKDADTTAKIIDRFSAVFGKINLNSQCGRSPDTLPFSGRRSSAMGVMSVKDALREFSVPTVVAYKNGVDDTAQLVEGIAKSSKFMEAIVQTA